MTEPSVEKVVIPDAPLKLKTHSKPLAKRMWAVLQAAADEARENYEVIYKYRVGKAHESELLNTAGTAEAVAFRQARQQHSERLATYKKEYEAEIAPFVARFEDRVKQSDAALKEREDVARKSINLETGVTAEENISALENYKAAAEMAKGIMQTLAKQGVVEHYVIPTVTGKVKGERGWTPRFSTVVVNEHRLPGTKLMDVAAAIPGSNRDFLLDVLGKSCDGKPGWEALEPESEVTFEVTVNGKHYAISVTKAPPPVRAVKNADGSLTEAPDDDDDEPEDEDDE